MQIQTKILWKPDIILDTERIALYNNDEHQRENIAKFSDIVPRVNLQKGGKIYERLCGL